MRPSPDSALAPAAIARPRTSPLTTTAALMLVDSVALLAAAFAAVALRHAATGAVQQAVWQTAWLAPFPVVLAFLGMGLYPAIGMGPAEELRRTTMTITLVYFALATAIFLSRDATTFSRGAFMIAWALSIMAVPLARAALRAAFARRAWWGASAIVIGSLEDSRPVLRSLTRSPRLGIKPIAVLDDGEAAAAADADLPVVGKLGIAAIADGRMRVPFAIVPTAGRDPAALLALVERYGKLFPHLVVVPDLFGSSVMWMRGRDLGGVLGFEVKIRLLQPGPRRAKRLLDLLVGVPMAVIALPLMALIAAAVRLDSAGPAFYSQQRIGQGGRRFRTWKFRTMRADADAVLEQCLAGDPELRAQWERDRKLRDDPRVTRVGRLLRRTSLDELPQLWNVLRGEMSLIGPRPIVQEEVTRYLDRFHLYGKLKPGLTGLWQVSGRSDTTYDERIEFDAYYARNWSVWLDAHILARTVRVVLLGKGAY